MKTYFAIGFTAAGALLAAVLMGNTNDQSWRQYQREAVAPDFTTTLGPQFAAWRCPTLNPHLNTLTEPCK